MIIKILPAFYGSCTLISWHYEGNKINILIDGGTPRTYHKHLKEELFSIASSGEFINLLIVTHVDEDHIGGIKELYQDVTLEKSFIKDVWFNCGNCISRYVSNIEASDRSINLLMSNQSDMSYKQGNTLEKLLLQLGWNPSVIIAPSFKVVAGATLQILSPTYDQLYAIDKKWEIEESRETNMSGKVTDHYESIEALLKKPFNHDNSLVNGSCISFLIKVAGKTLLVLADAFPKVVEESLRQLGYNEKNKLPAHAVIVAHHGSKFNNSETLYSIINSKAFIVSTDGTRDNMPHKEALARVVNSNDKATLYFNYTEPSKLFSVDEMIAYNFSSVDLSTQNYTIAI